MENPLVSVLLASYNHAPYVEAAVRSVMAQKGVTFELLVIDDGSTDESLQILNRLTEEYHFDFISRPNQGLVPTLNELRQKARGKYICTLASDDIMPADRLQMQSGYMEKHPEWPACFGQVRALFSDGSIGDTPDPRYIRGIPQVTFDALLLGMKELHGCTEMIHVDRLDEAGGYNEHYKIEDYPLWLALSFLFGPLPVVSDTFCYYRIHETSMHRRLNFIFPQVLEIISQYKDYPLYTEAMSRWKANWFSALAYEDKWAAVRNFWKLASWTWPFVKRIPKLFVPRIFLRQ